MEKIRKISIGPDYKNGMSYTVDQGCLKKDGVFTHEIKRIKESAPGEYNIEIVRNNEIKTWKRVQNMPVVLEYFIDFGE